MSGEKANPGNTYVAPPEKPAGLVAKLAAVMGAVGRIPKRGHNDFHDYNYATEADIVEAIRTELSTRNVMLIPGIKGHQREPVGDKGSTLTTLSMTFTFLDGDSEEKIERDWIGFGDDKLDKGGYKAMTGAEKYFLLKTFLIPTGDDPEAGKAEEADDKPSGGGAPLPGAPVQEPKPEAKAEATTTKAPTITAQMAIEVWDLIRVFWPDDKNKQTAILKELLAAFGVAKSAELPRAQGDGKPTGYWHIANWLDARKQIEKEQANAK